MPHQDLDLVLRSKACLDSLLVEALRVTEMYLQSMRFEHFIPKFALLIHIVVEALYKAGKTKDCCRSLLQN